VCIYVRVCVFECVCVLERLWLTYVVCFPYEASHLIFSKNLFAPYRPQQQ